MTITLQNKTADGKLLEVTYLPLKGMNMVSFKKDGLEIIDQSTKDIFDERFAGLGSLIGPHFHRRRESTLPKIQDESLFPHIAKVKSKGVVDPFSHGIARYSPWSAVSTENTVKAVLKGNDLFNGVPLKDLEGQNFRMDYEANLEPTGLYINLSIVSDTDSLVGLHYYYHLPQKKGVITTKVLPQVIEDNNLKHLNSSWNYNDQRELKLQVDEADLDVTFYPFPDPLNAIIELDAIDYRLKISYECQSQENSFQVYRRSDDSFVCIEPLSAKDPRHPNLTVSSLKVHLSIE